MYQDLVDKKAKLAVIGLGYVGLPIALEFAKKLSVIGFDINAQRIELMKQGIDAVPDKNAQAILQGLRMSARDNEVVLEADIPEKVVADYLKPAPTKVEISDVTVTKPAPKKPVRRKRTKH